MAPRRSPIATGREMAKSPAVRSGTALPAAASAGASDPHPGGSGAASPGAAGPAGSAASAAWSPSASLAADGSLAAVVTDGLLAEAVVDAEPAGGDTVAKIARARRPPPKLTIAEARPQPVTDAVAEAARLRVGRVRLWSVARVAFVLNLSFFVVFLVATISLWMVAASTGTVHQVEHWVASTLLVKNFRLRPQPLLQVAAGVGGLAMFVGTGGAVVLGALYNLIADVVGGIEVEVVDRSRPRRSGRSGRSGRRS